MPMLTNPRWELFAQNMASGKTADESYRLAGYKPNRHNAARLNTNENVRARIAELQEAAASRATITLETLLADAQATYRRATGAGQHSAANGSLTLIAKLLGLLVEKTENMVERDRLQADRAQRAQMASAGDLLAQAAASLGVSVHADSKAVARSIMLAARQQPFLPPAVQRLLNAAERSDHGDH